MAGGWAFLSLRRSHTERSKQELRNWTCLPAPLPQAFSLALSPRPGKHSQGKHGSPENGSHVSKGWVALLCPHCVLGPRQGQKHTWPLPKGHIMGCSLEWSLLAGSYHSGR